MNFSFNPTKATEAACRLIQQAGGRINIMKLVKLIYLLDRLSLARRGIPVVGGIYFSLPNGPVTSELLDLINSGFLSGVPDCQWGEFISDRENHEVTIEKAPPYDHLSEAELALIEETHREHGAKDQFQLRDWCHDHCEEWTPLERGRAAIPLQAIARALGKSLEEVQRMSEEAQELNLLTRVFAHG